MEEKWDPDDYWNKNATGYDFDDWLGSPAHNLDESEQSRGDSEKFNITPIRKNEDYQLPKSEGLLEAIENESVVSSDISSNINWYEGEDFNYRAVPKKCATFAIIPKNLKHTPVSADQTVKSIILGQQYSFYNFKGRTKKSKLLKAAVQSHDGNAILTVLLFLRNTLKQSIFQTEIAAYADALYVYLNYLEQHNEIEELTDMYLMMGDTEAAAMVKYNAAISVVSPKRKIKCIENCHSAHFVTGSVDSFLCESVAEHKQLLKDQIAIEEYRLATNPDEIELFKSYQELSEEVVLIDTSVMCSLIFCCLYYYRDSEAAFTSPGYIRKIYNLSKKQFTWGAVRSFMTLKKWTEMEDLLSSKNWRGNVTMKPCINLSEVVKLLSKLQAPQDITSFYVSHIENKQQKLALAKKHQCHSLVIQILKKNRDKQGLVEYKSILPPHSVDFCTAADILNDKSMKW